MAFVSVGLVSLRNSRSTRGHICDKRPALRRQACHVKMLSSEAPSSSASSLKSRIRESLEGLNRGLDIDADSDTMDEEESEVETLIEQLEDMNQCQIPTRDARIDGSWELLYTSSSLTRYFGGLTGLQRYFPDGSIGPIRQIIDLEDGTSSLEEVIEFEFPFANKRSSVTAIVSGELKAMSEYRQVWDAEDVRVSFFKWFADGWKTVRAFKVADTTYLDAEMRITRGQTGSVCVYLKELQPSNDE